MVGEKVTKQGTKREVKREYAQKWDEGTLVEQELGFDVAVGIDAYL